MQLHQEEECPAYPVKCEKCNKDDIPRAEVSGPEIKSIIHQCSVTTLVIALFFCRCLNCVDMHNDHFVLEQLVLILSNFRKIDEIRFMIAKR